jgi:hypothetical protein
MQYRILASDYDGTLAFQGQISETTVAALKRWRASGRQLLLVTGRHVPQLHHTLSCIDLFDAVVAENGANLYFPASGEERLLGEPPPDILVQSLRAQQVAPLIVGKGVVATLKPHEMTARRTIQKLDLNWRVILNKQDVMLLPVGVNKASGLRAALEMLGRSPAETVGIGDAENDHDLLDTCAYGVAVANALPELKARVDLVTQGEYGAGVTELIDRLLASDL